MLTNISYNNNNIVIILIIYIIFLRKPYISYENHVIIVFNELTKYMKNVLRKIVNNLKFNPIFQFIICFYFSLFVIFF